MEIIAFLMANKWIAGVLASLFAILAIYIKGYRSGSASSDAKHREAEDKLNSEVRSAEAKNQEIEREKQKDVQTINAARGVQLLIKLFDSFQKARRNKTDRS